MKVCSTRKVANRHWVANHSPSPPRKQGISQTLACAAGSVTVSRSCRHPPRKHLDLVHPGLALARVGEDEVAKLPGFAERRPIEDNVVASPFGAGLHPIVEGNFKN